MNETTMHYPTFFFLVAVILIASLIIGKRSASKVKSEADYFLSGRSLSFFKVTMTILATQLGGGAIVGTAEAAYNHGWSAIGYSAGLAIGLVILSFGIGAKFREMEVSTIPEIFKKYYDSEILRKASSVLYIVSMFLILVAIGVSARKFSLSVGFNNEITFIIFWVIIIAYTATGGLTAVTQTDILQIIFVLGSFLLTFMFLMNSDVLHVTKPFIPKKGAISFLSWLVVPCFFAIIGQDMAQRCFAAKSSATISSASIVAAFLLLISSLLPAYLGIIANKVGFEQIKGSSILIDMISEVTNPFVGSIFSCAILMAILSTADSLLCAISSNVALDFHFFRKKNLENANLSKIITVVIGLSAMVCSYFAEEIIPIMLIAYEISVSALAAPIIMTIILKSPQKSSAYASAILGILTYALLSILAWKYKEIVAIATSFVAFFLAEFIMHRIIKSQLKVKKLN